MKTPLKWWDWLLLTRNELRRRGVDPDTRYAMIGHKKNLPHRWARTIGLWGWKVPQTIMEEAGLNYADVTHRSAFDAFRYRASKDWHVKLLSLEQKSKRGGGEPGTGFLARVGDVYLATESYVFSLDLNKRSPGKNSHIMAQNLGIMPIEALLYTRAIETLLECLDMRFDDWIAGDEEDDWARRKADWDRFGLSIRLPPEACTAYPELYATAS